MEDRYDAVIVGAGFAGLYMLQRLRGLGLSAVVLEMGDDVGGTWYWNRYPGARCDAESLAYSFSWSPQLEQEWEWTERYATQPEILQYAQHVASAFDLRRDIRFGEKVTSAQWSDETRTWLVATEAGYAARAQFCIMATGCLSVPQLPDIPGLEDFAGERYQASLWPAEGVDFSGKRVGLIGTGSTGIQAVPAIAEQAQTLTVFQRTPNFSVPAVNDVLDASWVREFKKNYPAHRDLQQRALTSGFGDLNIEPVEFPPDAETAAGMSAEEVSALLERRWQRGGACFMGTFEDALVDPETNQKVADFVRDKIRTIVRDPGVAEILCPTDHPIGTKRLCVDTGYYETFNRKNVHLIDVRKDPIEAITAHGLKTQSDEIEFDVLVLATGFDAMTGALLKMDIAGEEGQSLKEKWAAGPRTYLGIGMQGFPNFFTITGPGSPSVLSNMLVSIEQHVDWLATCIEHMKSHGYSRVSVQREAEDAWVDRVNEEANATLWPQGGSWYLGANVPGKPRVFMPYVGGVGVFREICDEVTADGYRGFNFE